MDRQSRIDFFSLAHNNYSQNGEDGILEKIFAVENIARGYFIEFGAWDGMFLSNAYNLYRRGWTGCYIEGDPRKYRDLLRNVPDPAIKKLNLWVGSDGEHALDRIIEALDVSEVHLLSIDVDGADLQIWRSLRRVRPTVVVIEYNPTIPSEVAYENPRGANHGNSALAITEYAIANGYSLLEGTLTNLIFVRNDCRVLHVARPKTLADIAKQTNATKYFFGYDGTLITSSKIAGRQVNELIPVPWTAPICLFAQPIPRGLRRFSPPKSLSMLRFAYRALPSILLHPFECLRLLRHYLSSRMK